MEDEDFYFEGNLMVFTREFHLKRGECCGSGCRHCPYDPRWTKGTTAVEDKEREMTRLRKLPPEGGTASA